MARGVYRDGAFAQVSYDGRESVPISKALYEERGYDPPFEELPTKDEHEKGTGGERSLSAAAATNPAALAQHTTGIERAKQTS